MIRIIDNQKVEMTNDEFIMYENICKSYDDPPAQKGKDLFVDLFESDDNGMIIFLKPPHDRLCSFEVYLFMISLMNQQHLRCLYKRVDELCAKVDEKLKELK